MTTTTTTNDSIEDTILPPPSILEFILFPFFILAFLGTLILFDIIIKIISFTFPKGKEWVALWFNTFVLYSLKVVGTRLSVIGQEHLPPSGPCIIISNHQSMFDIPSIHVTCRKLLPRFVAKKELGKGTPGVSACLRISDAALIDRSDATQALREIKRFGKFIKETSTSGVIFPEGTRARFHTPRAFKTRGVNTLIKETAPIWIVPITIQNSWKLQARKFGPLPIGVNIILNIHPPHFIKNADHSEETILKVEQEIKSLLVN
jgi:1-acyl-sn-glycerol-3-phosphate acyltransferase